VLLFGPPGTAKTTIAKGIADGLSWPVVSLSPGDFIVDGLEHIETHAKSVFSRLMQLSRAVVIFDECDELFRERIPNARLEQARGITAFITASMLPKLQELHDRGRVLFFICTNHFESLDAAMKRGGRVDHVIAVGPPDERARRELLMSMVLDLRRDTRPCVTQPYEAVAISTLAKCTKRFTRPELNLAAGQLVRRTWNSEERAKKAAEEVARRIKPSLVIRASVYNTFLAQRKEFSHAIVEGA